ncbi:hypothetical protein CQW23_13331 [Capsicum baccatum]|uniref:Uncharacterized protein n=1 Tax=Capsicum baccatum TaxID=33114 RepID=A0A2G2WV61_CAPBA|nr:hypothetical protein CQW23_13331 [Capsicum baccatum]
MVAAWGFNSYDDEDDEAALMALGYSNLAEEDDSSENKKNETVHHVAANEGHIKVVHSLLSMEEHYKETLMRMTDDNGDTALYMAAWSRHQYVAQTLGERRS